jgi:hypothetical protein
MGSLSSSYRRVFCPEMPPNRAHEGEALIDIPELFVVFESQVFGSSQDDQDAGMVLRRAEEGGRGCSALFSFFP